MSLKLYSFKSELIKRNKYMLSGFQILQAKRIAFLNAKEKWDRLSEPRVKVHVRDSQSFIIIR